MIMSTFGCVCKIEAGNFSVFGPFIKRSIVSCLRSLKAYKMLRFGRIIDCNPIEMACFGTSSIVSK